MKPRNVSRILMNFPTNIGDAIFGFPALDRLRACYPDAHISAIASPYTTDLISRNSFIDETIIFNKRWHIREKIIFTFSVWGKFDMIVDLKNSFLPMLIGARYCTPFRRASVRIHATRAYIEVIRQFAPHAAEKKSDFRLEPHEAALWQALKIESSVFVACASRSSLKTYPRHLLKKVLEELSCSTRIVLLGEACDREYYGDIADITGVVDLTGKTKLYDIAYILAHYARMLIAVDSSIMQLASYLDIPVLALFGPTDPARYGPWSRHSLLLQKKTLSCVPCEQAACALGQECMDIDPRIVLDGFRSLLDRSQPKL